MRVTLGLNTLHTNYSVNFGANKEQKPRRVYTGIGDTFESVNTKVKKEQKKQELDKKYTQELFNEVKKLARDLDFDKDLAKMILGNAREGELERYCSDINEDFAMGLGFYLDLAEDSFCESSDYRKHYRKVLYEQTKKAQQMGLLSEKDVIKYNPKEAYKKLVEARGDYSTSDTAKSLYKHFGIRKMGDPENMHKMELLTKTLSRELARRKDVFHEGNAYGFAGNVEKITEAYVSESKLNERSKNRYRYNPGAC